MKTLTGIAMTLVLALVLQGCVGTEGNGPVISKVDPQNDGWVDLFDGKTLAGWKTSEENPDSFSVREGMLCVESGRSHLFYDGPVAEHNFKNFEFKAEVMTTKGSNSGLFIHTKYQASGWPSKGYEAQVNATHKDAKKTASVYNCKNVMDVAPHVDDEWFEYHIIVQGKTITINIKGVQANQYVEPADPGSPPNMERFLSSGTFAIQAHDPKSKTYYKNIRVKVLPE